MSVELPLFPLHTVLFPGAPLSLHVFEPRYLALIEHCVEHACPFGVVGIRHGVEALGPLPEPVDVGCTAHIVEASRLPSGRLDVSAVGGERFRIERVSGEGPYLRALVEAAPLPAGDASANRAAERRLRRRLGRYLAVLAAASETRADLSSARLPSSPYALAYLAASLLRLAAPIKQELLESPDLTTMLSNVAGIYKRELPVLETLIGQSAGAPGSGPFSRN